MQTLGLDIGTTSISAVVCEEGAVLASKTIDNDSNIGGETWESLQDAGIIFRLAKSLVESLLMDFPDLSAIGLTGQMHGILYLDAQGNPVSPLYSWKDGRGDLPYSESETWAQHLSNVSGHALSTGFGGVTHAFNVARHLVPEEAVVFCTIGDFIAMKLSGGATPLIHPTNAASLGFFDRKKNIFDLVALEKVGLSPSLFPDLARDDYLEGDLHGVKIAPAIGDNQASFLGATEEDKQALLINFGTGSQISLYSPNYMALPGLDTRPYMDGGYLLVGAALAGGLSFAYLENFFRKTVAMVTGKEEKCYGSMMATLDRADPEDFTRAPVISPLFQGSREDPSLTASITGLRPDNFTPLHFIIGMMKGMSRELYLMYEIYRDRGGKRPDRLIGSGNGLRLNPYLRAIVEEDFGGRLELSGQTEEAAYGAAMYAGKFTR